MNKGVSLSYFLTIILYLIILLSFQVTSIWAQSQTFLKFYSRPQIQTLYGGFSFKTSDGKILVSADFYNGIIAILDKNGTIVTQRKVTTQFGLPLLKSLVYPLEQGEISIMGIAPGQTHMIVFGILRSDLTPKFIRAVDLSKLPFDTTPSSIWIAKKVSDGYYGFVEFEDENLFYLVKLDHWGNIVWIREYELAEDHTFYSFKELSDGTFALAGGLHYSGKFSLARGDLSGVVYTARSYESQSTNLMLNWADDLAEGVGGVVYLVGSGRYFNREGIVLLSVSKSGDLIWAKFISPEVAEYYSLSADRVLVGSDGSLYVVGTISQGSRNGIYVLKLGLTGEILTEKFYHITDIGLSVYNAYFIDNDLYISGNTWYNNKLGFYLMKLDYDANLYGCNLSQSIKFTVNDITNLIKTSPLKVISQVINRSIPVTDFRVNLSSSDLTVIDICYGTGSSTPSSPFVDVSPSHWAYRYILWVRERGISTGYSDGTFKPDAFVTRQEMSAMLVRAIEGENFLYNSIPYFVDVNLQMWSFKYIQRLYELGLTRGCGVGYFCPYDYVTRAQMATFLVRLLVGDNFQYSSDPYFADVSSTHWAFKYVQKARELGLITGYEDRTFRPDRYITRAEVSTLLYRAFNR